jgi:hypothetical protein
VFPEIDLWRAATLVLKRYDDRTLEGAATGARLDAASSLGCAVCWRTALRGLSPRDKPRPASPVGAR